MDLPTSRAASLYRLAPQAGRPGERLLAVETPIAISFLGIGYAVMMATPADLEDFGTGFALSERIIDRAGQITDISIVEEERGLLLNIEVAAERQDLVLERVRHRAGE